MINRISKELVFKQGIRKGSKLLIEALPHINQKIVDKVIISKKFLDYVQKIQNAESSVNVSKIQILGVEMFGNNVGFVNMKAITEKDGFALPSYIFLRGPAVAILILVNNKVLVVEQYRVPIQQTILEAPAGMLDESGDFAGKAAEQIEQQTSIKIKRESLKSLGSYFPSVGGSDEQILMFYSKINLSEAQMQEIQKKVHGKEGQKQRIKVRFIDFKPEQILSTKDSKLICLMYAYQNLEQAKKSNL